MSNTDRMPQVVTGPPKALFRAVAGIKTPALVYDTDGIDHTVTAISKILEIIPSAKLNIALKACRTESILKTVSAHGVGADVASIAELELAQKCDFKEISATGPSFSETEDFERLANAGVTLDVDSVDQLRSWGNWRPGGDVGLRIRMEFPESLRGVETFGSDSRFGVQATSDELFDVITEHRLRVTRLHVHTGQMDPRALVYKVNYLLKIASAIETVSLLDLGGGFFHLFHDPHAAINAMRHVQQIIDEWTTEHSRPIAIRFEPGGALLAPYGYLFTRVLSVEKWHEEFSSAVATVDCSSWNLTPWHSGQILQVRSIEDTASMPVVPTRIAGNTLYENDLFGTNINGVRKIYDMPDLSVGDVLVVTACGAYTITNSRTFNGLTTPREFKYSRENGLQEM